MRTRMLFFIGLALLMLALGALVLLSTRSFPRETLTSSVSGEELVPPTPTFTPTATWTPPPPTPTPTPRPPAPTLAPPTLTAVPRTPTPPPTPTPRPPTPSATATPSFTPLPPTPSPILVPSPTPAPLATVMIEAEWPEKVEIDRSDSIRVSLVRTTDQVYIPTIEIPGHEVIVGTPIPVGTPEAPIAEAFGPEYGAYAIANLAGAAFEVSALTTEYQSLEQPQINWEWNITPNKPGLQVVNVKIEVEWRPVGSDGPAITRQIWRSRLDILVEKPLISTVQLNIWGLVNGFLGSALSVPFVYERIKERRKKRQEGKESRPKPKRSKK